jgi:anaerobic ribonucleoside-triphosphate reductase activating protein
MDKTQKRTLRLYLRIPKTQVLGPFLRYALWTQGCYQNCKGCIAKSSHDVNGGYDMNIESLAKEILDTKENEGIEGITISGGEPFLQAENLSLLLSQLKQHTDLGVIIYSGYTYEQLQQDPKNTELLKYCDLLIDGTYKEELDDTKSLRGSSNQNIIPLSDRYITLLKQNYAQELRKVEFHLQDEQLMLVGIPGKKSLEQFKQLVTKN